MAMQQPATQALGQDQQVPQEQDPLSGMIVQVDQALTKLSQLFGKQSPEAGQALAALNEQYRQIVQAVLQQTQGGQTQPRAQQAQQMASPEAGVRSETKPAM